MRSARVLEAEITRQRGLHLPHRLVGVQVDVPVLHAAPQPPTNTLFHPAPFAVHAHAHARQCCEDLWGAVARERLLQGLDAKLRAQRALLPRKLSILRLWRSRITTR